MIQLRKSETRGRTRLDWLDSYHSFSFGEYHDPAHMGYSSLRVLNEDSVAPGGGFAPHAHRDMEIVTYVLTGALEHKDSLGNGSVIRPNDVQRMSAGGGIRHSEYNASQTEPVHLLQIWILPDRTGLPPGYEQKSFAPAQRRGRLCLVASPDGREGSVTVHQDALVYAVLLDSGEVVDYRPRPGRRLYVHVARGRLRLNGEALTAGDGARVEREPDLKLGAGQDAEALLFDLPW